MGKVSYQKYNKIGRSERNFCIVLRVLICIFVVGIVWFECIGCGWGVLDNARSGTNWPENFAVYGQMLLFTAFLLTVSAVLVLIHRKNWINWLAVGLATIGIVLCIVATVRISAYAEENGFYSKLLDISAASLYRLELYPAIFPYLCIVLLGLFQFFGTDAQELRRLRKQERDAEAPKIV